MAKKQYISNEVKRTARPRSKRLQDLGISGGSAVAVSGSPFMGNWHIHDNKAVLDSLSTDNDQYLYLAKAVENSNGEYEYYLHKIRAGYADEAGTLAADSAIWKILNLFAPIYNNNNDVIGIQAKYSMCVQGEVTAYAGTPLSVSSIFSGLPIDNDTIYWDGNTLKALGGGLSNVTVRLGEVAYQSNNGIVSLPIYPTSLPASDVYAWAKASVKPSYNWSEILNKPLTFTPSTHTHPYSQLSGTVPTWNQNTTGNAATATNLSNKDTVTLGTATERNSITISQPSFTTDKPVKLLNFNWYDTVWSVGNIRSGSSQSNGLGIFKDGTEIGRFTASGWVGNSSTATNALQLNGVGSAGYGQTILNKSIDVNNFDALSGLFGGKLSNAANAPFSYYPFLHFGVGEHYCQFNSTGNVLYFRSSKEGVIHPEWRRVLSYGTDGITQAQHISANGNITASGEITAYSDERLKSNIAELKNRGYVAPKTYIKDDKESIGFIAQDVQELYPELVTKDDKGYLSVNYMQYCAVLQAQVIELNNRIKKLEK